MFFVCNFFAIGNNNLLFIIDLPSIFSAIKLSYLVLMYLINCLCGFFSTKITDDFSHVSFLYINNNNDF